jgi:alpha-1,3-glucosyltransferase
MTVGTRSSSAAAAAAATSSTQKQQKQQQHLKQRRRQQQQQQQQQRDGNVEVVSSEHKNKGDAKPAADGEEEEENHHRERNSSSSMSQTKRAAWLIFWCTTALKLLLVPLYRSTDFAVHRNWLAITHSLPLREWYTDATSKWTLDYPPFFAWFEYGLAHVAALLLPTADARELLRVTPERTEHRTATIWFQRLSVMCTDIVLFAAIVYFLRVVQRKKKQQQQHTLVLLLLTFANPGLLIVDHIHFQYNGVLFGDFILSIALVHAERDLLAGICFAVLLNLKHIFLYVAPVYFVYLLVHYCHRVRNFCKLAASVLLVFALSLGPFATQLPQLVARLFPFKRGLMHAYWAPNVWALYTALDKALAAALGLSSSSSMTGGLVAVSQHAVLPSVAPVACMLLTLL